MDDIMVGAIDIHIHSSPDVSDRSITDFEVADLARKRGFKAIVIKNHVNSTVGRVVLVNSKSEKIIVFGGVTLNKAVGGINPDAVEAMYRMSEQYGKFVWFPTVDAAYQIEKNNQKGEGLSVLQNNKISPQTILVLNIIAKENLILATGHLSPKEIFLLLPEAKKLGISKILINHPMGATPGLSIDQMTEVVKMGAILELTYLNILTGQNAPGDPKSVTIEQTVKTIKQIGAKNIIITSDLGRVGYPLPPDGLKTFVELLMAKGITVDEINWMIKSNPGKLLGIE